MASSISKIKAFSKLHLRAHHLIDAASWICAAALIGLILLAGQRDNGVSSSHEEEEGYYMEPESSMRGGQFRKMGCDEIYVVGEGETLHTISDKCGDPFIVERNPHIHDPDDVFPGLVIKVVVPSKHRKVFMS